MAGPNPTDLEHERALAKLRSAAVQLGLAYEVLEGIATAPALQQLPSNKQRRFHVYQAVAHALGVVSLPLTHAGCVPGRFAGLKSLQCVCRWVMETAPNSGPTWRRRYGCSTRTQQALPTWASGPRSRPPLATEPLCSASQLICKLVAAGSRRPRCVCRWVAHRHVSMAAQAPAASTCAAPTSRPLHLFIIGGARALQWLSMSYRMSKVSETKQKVEQKWRRGPRQRVAAAGGRLKGRCGAAQSTCCSACSARSPGTTTCRACCAPRTAAS